MGACVQYSKAVAASVTSSGRSMLLQTIQIVCGCTPRVRACVADNRATQVHRYASYWLTNGQFVHCYSPKPEEKGVMPPTQWFRFTEVGELVTLQGPPDPHDVQHITAHSVIYGGECVSCGVFPTHV